ncbi:hypothetical protein NP233_g6923 [Leucocoprinus birnbaumii]|uniref:Uncharacterized protein n=1 Tax=Leucocoprinus birnbaumii TaxID=56174 RepID=A0AAD5YQH7_9AGAR|nr:hypothetical protein NP233_g6923 [Leucocoprinus birnbaumii]
MLPLKIVAYWEKGEPPKEFWTDTKAGPEIFRGLYRYTALTRYPDIEQEIYAVNEDKFISMDSFFAKGYLIETFCITKPVSFRTITCWGLEDYVNQLKKLESRKGAESPTSALGSRKRRLSDSDTTANPALSKRLRERIELLLRGEGSKTRVVKRAQKWGKSAGDSDEDEMLVPRVVVPDRPGEMRRSISVEL